MSMQNPILFSSSNFLAQQKPHLCFLHKPPWFPQGLLHWVHIINLLRTTEVFLLRGPPWFTPQKYTMFRLIDESHCCQLHIKCVLLEASLNIQLGMAYHLYTPVICRQCIWSNNRLSLNLVIEFRGRPLLIWGGGRRKPRKKISKAIL